MHITIWAQKHFAYAHNIGYVVGGDVVTLVKALLKTCLTVTQSLRFSPDSPKPDSLKHQP